jgi:hypothetical protein
MRTVLSCLFLIFYTTAAFGNELYLRDNLSHAQQGDYVVITNDKNQTFMRVLQKDPDFVTIEEITIPASSAKSIKSWIKWAEAKAPNHTSWVRYQVNLNNGHTSEFTSLSQDGWRDIPQINHLFSTLLNLRFTKVPDRDRRRIGTHRGSSNVNPRFFWHPPLMVNGQKIPGAIFNAWHARWPKDGGDLSGKLIEIYIPKLAENFPSYFPYWIEINSGIKVRMHVADSGRAMLNQ